MHIFGSGERERRGGRACQVQRKMADPTSRLFMPSTLPVAPKPVPKPKGKPESPKKAKDKKVKNKKTKKKKDESPVNDSSSSDSHSS